MKSPLPLYLKFALIFVLLPIIFIGKVNAQTQSTQNAASQDNTGQNSRQSHSSQNTVQTEQTVSQTDEQTATNADTQETADNDGVYDDADINLDDFLTDDDTVSYSTTVEGERPLTADLSNQRAKSEVTREQLESRLPRSAPDALRYEPGVFVQQTAHSQGSAFIRGMTGQQTLILFDGIRLNNSTYRQGPNQYFFTLDSQSIDAIQVMRGGGSTTYGSDALGGVILAKPINASLRDPFSQKKITSEPLFIIKGATADREFGGRIQSNLTIGKSFAAFGGIGARYVGLLESGGMIYSPSDGLPPQVPQFAEDNRTQLGTGFKEFTFDRQFLYEIAKGHQIKLAAYMYRQFDAPRTDQCPAAYAPYNQCLTYDEQFRELAYLAYEAMPQSKLVAGLRATLSFQRQHERRSLNRPTAFVLNEGRDDVYTFGATVTGKTKTWRPLHWLGLQLKYGADNYYDVLDSDAWITFTDIDYTEKRSRGQYLDGATYLYGGAFVNGSAEFLKRFRLRAGSRVSWINANADPDVESGSAAVDQKWIPLVWNTGLDIFPKKWIEFIVNVDRSFRAPNLDDMTSRQQTGPGFQFENSRLKSEQATTYEAGIKLKSAVSAELWGFVSHIDNAIVRSPRTTEDCPENTPMCGASWNKFQLVNADGRSLIRGLEAVVLADLPKGFSARSTISWTFGEGPNTGEAPTDPSLPFEKKVPLSRIPPLNGTVELLWKHKNGFSTGTTLRWSAKQDRLALADVSDERIPNGGTPSFAVFDLRLSYRPNPALLTSVTVENIFDAAYRYHGSSVNGPGLGIMFLINVGPVWRP